MVLITLFSLTTPAGIIFGIVLSGMSSVFEAFFLSISAGTFLYISASEVIVEEFSVGGHKILKFFGFLLGSIIIALFTVFEYVKF
jgi:zinc transporter ZupT